MPDLNNIRRGRDRFWRAAIKLSWHEHGDAPEKSP
jgi:hypothetical protein